MQKTFLSNLVLLLLANIIIKPLWTIGIEVNVQRILGPEVYGNYFALLNFAFLFTVLMDFGLNSFNNRRVARNPQRMPEYLASLGTLKLFLGLVFIAIMQIVAHFIGFTEQQTRLLWGVGAIIFLQSFLLFLRSNISGIQWYRADVLISVLDRTISIVLCALLIWGGFEGFNMNIENFILVQILAYIIGILVCATLLMKRVKKISFSLRIGQAIKVLKESFWYALLVMLVLSYYRIDAVMIERLLPSGDFQAGLYAQAYKLLEASIIFAYLFSTLLLPMFSRMIKKREEIQSLVRLADQLMLIPATILSIGAAFFGSEIMEVLYEEGIQRSAEVFTILILSLIPIGASYIYGTLITAKGDLKTLNVIAASGLVINVIGNSWMIPEYGIYGAAIVTLCTQSIVCFSQVIVAHRMFNMSISAWVIIKILLMAILLPTLAWSVAESLQNWTLELIIFFVVSFLLASALGLFSIRKIGAVLQLRENM
ncbi:MAG: oligosaccharide flippase family protein [Flavobacteriales bacterium]|nr:oligosaccharide flippase family protein [Flavobacteriales bacterium]